jgi:probable rRNA maturation factor
MSIDVCNESGRPVDEAALVSLARHVLRAMRIHPLAELSILLVDPGAMEELHRKWMDEPGPTDVLSFPMDELRPGSDDEDPEPGLLGDVVLCPEVAEQQARDAGHSFEDELHLLCTHGILHLLGYEHGEPEEQHEMFELQAQLLASWQEARRAAGGRR